MTTPERLPETPTQPEAPKSVEQVAPEEQAPTGAPPSPGDQQAQPPAADPTQADQQLPQQQSVTVPVSNEEQLKSMSKGSPGQSSTWFGVFWLRNIKKALQKRLKIVFGGK